MNRILLSTAVAVVASTVSATFAQTQGPSTSRTPYLVPVAPGVVTKSIFTVGTVDRNPSAAGTVTVTQDSVGGYTMSGIPDGLGAYDNGNGTFTLLANHEIGSTLGVTRAHGSVGSFISKWVINKSDFSVVSGTDLIQSVSTWNTSTTSYNAAGTTAFNRFCSADLAAQSAYQFGGLGTGNKIYLNGEEGGTASRAFAHVVDGPDAGKSWELPALGKYSFENAVANPYAQTKTIVGATDDDSSGNAQVYFYVGTKTSTGLDIDEAGLTNGTLKGIKLDSGVTQETRGSGLASTGPLVKTATFTLADLGDVRNTSGTSLNTISNSANVMRFSRPEDSAWDPANPKDYYFVTTDNTTANSGRSRLWKTSFNDLANPDAGGTLSMLLTGTEGQEMFDNMSVIHSQWGNVGDGHTRIVLLEDVGGNARSGKVWLYDATTGDLTEVAKHEVSRFGDGATLPTSPFTNDEEASGVIDAGDILGPGWFLLDTQAHYSGAGNGITTADVEGGQLQAIFIPQAIPEPTSLSLLAVGGAALLRRRRARH